jgi:hypothetical protein
MTFTGKGAESKADILRLKWEDWTQSIGLPYAPLRLQRLASRLYVDGRSAIRRMDLSLLAVQMARVVRIGKFQLSRLETLESLESELLDRLDRVVTGTE